MLKNQSTDSDLVELAGYHAYLNYEDFEMIYVNESTYYVENTYSDPITGLDALTVKNLDNDNNEHIVVFVGTDAKQLEDIKTDIFLLSDTNVPQLEEALLYYEDMVEEFGVIDSVTGNWWCSRQ